MSRFLSLPPADVADAGSAQSGTGTAGRPEVARDTRALARFELFLFTAVLTILVVRGALAATGYPKVGGGELHVAHVLYGGLLMGIAIVMVQILPGGRTRVRAAFVGGIGFGLFLDEVGKFLTKDVNYFYKPAVAVIYAVLVVFYLVVREVIAHRPLNDRRRLALAASAASDLALGQLDEAGRNRALAMLTGTEPASMAEGIRATLMADRCSGPRHEEWLSRRRDAVAERSARALRSRRLTEGIGVLMILQFLGIVFELALVLLQPAIGRTHGSHVTDVGAVIATLVSLVYVSVGLLRLTHRDHRGAIRVLLRSAFVTLLFTQLFVFVRYQWSGLIGFALEGLLMAVVRLELQAFHDDDDVTFDSSGALRQPGVTAPGVTK